jgi:lipoprotein NlpI
MKNFNGAVDDFNQAIEIDPLNVNAYAYRGLVKDYLKNYDDAIADCSKAIELDPQKVAGYDSLGFVQNDQMQFQPALESFRKSIQLDPLLDYPRFRIWLIRSRLGEQDSATTELSAYLKSLQGTQGADWTAKIGQFLVGTMTEDDFLNVAKTSARNPKQQNVQLCQACYYAGMKHLIAGDKDGANTLLKKCTSTGEKGVMEYASAVAELSALKK